MKYLVDVNGERIAVELDGAHATVDGIRHEVAPMPGLVVRVAVAVGDQGAAGQGLVVIEAMKMENELRSASAGVVTAVRAVTGQAVDKGAVLVEIGPLASA